MRGVVSPSVIYRRLVSIIASEASAYVLTGRMPSKGFRYFFIQQYQVPGNIYRTTITYLSTSTARFACFNTFIQFVSTVFFANILLSAFFPTARCKNYVEECVIMIVPGVRPSVGCMQSSGLILCEYRHLGDHHRRCCCCVWHCNRCASAFFAVMPRASEGRKHYTW